MEVVFGVLFLPCPLDLNGTKFSCKDGEERRGCLGWELAANLCTGSPSSNTLSGKLQLIFSAYTMKLLCVQKPGEKQLDFLSSVASIVFTPF